MADGDAGPVDFEVHIQGLKGDALFESLTVLAQSLEVVLYGKQKWVHKESGTNVYVVTVAGPRNQLLGLSAMKPTLNGVPVTFALCD